jgi:thiaminase
MDFVDVIARAFASTSKYAVKRRLGEFLGAIVVGEGEIFRKSLRALWAVSPETAAAKKETTGSLAARMSSFLRRVGDEGCFLTRIAVVAVAEGLYAGWAERASDEDVERTSRRETTPSSDGDVDDETLFRMEQELYAKWIHPLHASEEFKEAVKDFIDAFEEAWDDADDEARARAKRAIDEMLDLEVEFTRLLEV